MLLEVDAITVAYAGKPAIERVSLRLADGHIGCLLGPSGCGKTTVLRAVAGFEPLVAGRIALAGREVSTPNHCVPPERRGVGMVFQDSALFSHLTVAGNVAFGIRDWSAAERRARITELLALVGLPTRGDAYPHELSGGEAQRVALARALAPRPRLLLLDEPFSSLDATLRTDIARQVRHILRSAGMTALLVTHDQSEAFAMAEEIGVMADGRLRQWAKAYDIYHQPADRFVARFVGQGSLIEGTAVDRSSVSTALGTLASRTRLDCAPGATVEVLMRPDDLVCVDAADAPLTGRVESREFLGAEYLYTIRLDGGEQVLSLARSHDSHAVGARVGLRLDARHVIVFPAVPASA
jgi:iron(III) transport system ATP-binding protein